jgi:uncharacterized protein with HEPN domain
MLDRAILHLTIIADTIPIVRSYLGSRSGEALLADPVLCDAVAMRLQTVGEAARHILPDQRKEAPEIAWADIVAFLHRIAHDYRHVDFEIVWRIAKTELDALETAVRRMLAACGE